MNALAIRPPDLPLMPRTRRTTPTATPASAGAPRVSTSSRELSGRLLVARCQILELLAEWAGYQGPELAGLAQARRDLERVLALGRAGIVA